jgi:hypothetical protein
MIAHALEIIQKELNGHLDLYPPANGGLLASLDNIASIIGASGPNSPPEAGIYLTLVNLKEEKALKNQPNYVRNDVTLKAIYENPPVFVNFLLLFTVVHNSYTPSLTVLSRIIRFFQSKNVFTPDTVSPNSLESTLIDPEDQLESFKLILDLYSPSLEEVNHLWGTLGGKQYPSALYVLRLLDLKFKSVQSESSLIRQVTSDFYHKKPART